MLHLEFSLNLVDGEWQAPYQCIICDNVVDMYVLRRENTCFAVFWRRISVFLSTSLCVPVCIKFVIKVISLTKLTANDSSLFKLIQL